MADRHTSDNIEKMTVGRLISELEKMDSEYSEYDVHCRLPDDRLCCVTGTWIDETGDLCMYLEEDGLDEGYYDVGMLIDELKLYDGETRVYMAACGLLLGFSTCPDGLCSYDDVNDQVFFDAVVTGSYREEDDDRNNAGRETEMIVRKERRRETAQTVVLALLGALLALGLVHNVVALCSRSGSVLENILWIVVHLFLLTVCGLTLFYGRDRR